MIQRCEACGGLIRKSTFDQAACRCNKRGRVRRVPLLDALPPQPDETAEDVEQLMRMEL